VQIVYSSRRVAHRMKHVGSAHDEQELEALLAAAAAVVVVCTISTVIRVLSALRHRQLAAPRRRSRDRRPPCAGHRSKPRRCRHPALRAASRTSWPETSRFAWAYEDPSSRPFPAHWNSLGKIWLFGREVRTNVSRWMPIEVPEPPQCVRFSLCA
jgi:hypothetical protein